MFKELIDRHTVLMKKGEDFDVFTHTVRGDLKPGLALEIYFFIEERCASPVYVSGSGDAHRFWFTDAGERATFRTFLNQCSPPDLGRFLWPGFAEIDALLTQGIEVRLAGALSIKDQNIQVKKDGAPTVAAVVLYQMTRQLVGRVFYGDNRFRFENAEDAEIMTSFVEEQRVLLEVTSEQVTDIFGTTKKPESTLNEKMREYVEVDRDRNERIWQDNVYRERDRWVLEGGLEPQIMHELIDNLARKKAARGAG